MTSIHIIPALEYKYFKTFGSIQEACIEWPVLQSSLHCRCTPGLSSRIYTFHIFVKKLGSFGSWVISVQLDDYVNVKQNGRFRIGQGDSSGIKWGVFCWG